MFRRGWPIGRSSGPGGEKGSTFVEVLMALIVLSFIVAAVPPAIIFSTKAVFAQKEQTVAEHLTRNQIEYLKSCAYDSLDDGSADYAVADVPDPSYAMTVTVQAVDVDDTGEHLGYLGAGEDEGIQEITVEIGHVNRVVLTTRFFKVDR